ALGDRSATYGYDARYRLTSAGGDFADGHTLTMSYDANGNLLSRASTDSASPLNISSLMYATAASGGPLHALRGQDADGDGVVDVAFLYDASGNLTQDDRFAMTYDAYGKLASVDELAGSHILSYVYDHQRRRIATSVPSGSDVFYLRPAEVEIRTVGGQESFRRNIMFAGHLVGVIDGHFSAETAADHIFLFASDHLGTPLQVMDVDSPASIIEEHAVFPFGAENTHPTQGLSLAAHDPATKLSRRFQGRELDSSIPEFYNFGARTYRSDFARFMSADSVVPDPEASASWNRYTFVQNNPLRYIDPSGHDEEPVTTQASTQEDERASSPEPSPSAIQPTGVPVPELALETDHDLACVVTGSSS
ncbi:MAG: RHS repeat-associated core domain-containing protein, partial [Myxococcota bacterium]